MLSLGHDAELFACDENGDVVSCEGKIGGTKEHPSPCKGGALQEDCVMAELNITPATNSTEFVRRTNTVLEELEKRLSSYSLRPFITPAAELDANELNTEQSLLSGCKPDYDAWEMKENPAIELGISNMRYAGGHIHFGVDFKDRPAVITRFIRYLDMTLGCGMLLKYGVSERFKAYGRFGAYRTTPYGCEYRVPDNTWLKSDADMKWVYELCRYVYNIFMTNPNAEAKLHKDFLLDAVSKGDMNALRYAFREHCRKDSLQP